MGDGYVLNFSNQTFQEFVADSVRRNIYDDRYMYASGSKANLLRGFWSEEGNPPASSTTAGAPPRGT